MIKEALQYLVGLGEANGFSINGRHFMDKPIHEVGIAKIRPMEVNSLEAVITYVKSIAEGEKEQAKSGISTKEGATAMGKAQTLVVVKSPLSVEVTMPATNAYLTRQIFLEANRKACPFAFGSFYDAEGFNIAMQSMFLDTEDKATILKVVGNLKEESVRTLGDDGVSQSVTAKVGIATVSEVKVPNPVELRPYRTFLEVEQPTSKFIFRMKDGGRCALFEADGGQWEEEAKRNIYKHLDYELNDLIQSGDVILMR